MTGILKNARLEPGETPLFSRKDLTRLIFPLIIENFLAFTIGMADSMMVASCGEAAVSGVSLVDAVNLLLINVFSALTTGGAVVVSQYLGRHDLKNANTAAKQLIVSTALFSAAIMAVCLAFNPLLLRTIFGSVEPVVMHNAQTYFFWSALSYPFLGIYNSGAALYRSMGNSKISMVTSVIMNLWNVCGNALLIFGFQMGVAGAAIATLTSRMLGAVLMMVLLRVQHNPIRLDSLDGFMPRFGMIKSILKIGVPTGLENGMFQIGKVLVQGLVSSFGTVAIAANAVSGTISALSVIPSSAVSLALVTVVGQCMGAGKKNQACMYARNMVLFAWAAMAAMCGILLLLLNPLLSLYQLEPETISTAQLIITSYMIAGAIFWVLSFVLPNALRAAGDVRFTMTVSMLSMWLCRVVAAYLLAQYLQLGVFGVWLAMYVDWIARLTAFVIRFIRGKWLEKKVI